jgi:hypothetical protein
VKVTRCRKVEHRGDEVLSGLAFTACPATAERERGPRLPRLFSRALRSGTRHLRRDGHRPSAGAVETDTITGSGGRHHTERHGWRRHAADFRRQRRLRPWRPLLGPDQGPAAGLAALRRRLPDAAGLPVPRRSAGRPPDCADLATPAGHPGFSRESAGSAIGKGGGECPDAGVYEASRTPVRRSEQAW